MNNLIEKLTTDYPLLDVMEPREEIAINHIDDGSVPDGMHALIYEFITRYAFVAHKTRKGEEGEQAAKNRDEQDFLKAAIYKLNYSGSFTFKYFGYTAIVKIDFNERPSIDLKFLIDITPIGDITA